MSVTAKVVRSAAALAFGAIAYGCASVSSGPAFTEAPPPPPGHGLVYVFRADDFKSGLSSPEVRLNGKPIVHLASGGYTWIHVRADRYVVTTVNAATGEEYAPRFEFVLEDHQTAGLFLSSLPSRTQLSGGLPVPGAAVLLYSNANATQHPFVWGFIDDILRSARYADLTTRRYQPALDSASRQ